MRARLALAYSGIKYEHREILLNDRPEELYALSAKGTVPVFQLKDKTVIDESIDVMKWALSQSDPECWYTDKKDEQDSLIVRNDGEFKKRLDQYKYQVRFKDGSYVDYQKAVDVILAEYESILTNSTYFSGEKIRLVDMALFPFVRQCAHVDLNWFNEQFPNLFKWLDEFKTSDLFISIIKKYDVWESQTDGIIVDWNKLQK